MVIKDSTTTTVSACAVKHKRAVVSRACVCRWHNRTFCCRPTPLQSVHYYALDFVAADTPSPLYSSDSTTCSCWKKKNVRPPTTLLHVATHSDTKNWQFDVVVGPLRVASASVRGRSPPAATKVNEYR